VKFNFYDDFIENWAVETASTQTKPRWCVG
jgi:hypothetical protein